MARRCALLPLGPYRGPDALDVWEHFAFSDWAETHALPCHEAREELLQRAFEQEHDFWQDMQASPDSDLESLGEDLDEEEIDRE